MADNHEAAIKPKRESAFALLRALFAEAEVNVAGLGLACAKCGQCCRFGEMEHILFATALEIDYLVQTSGLRPPRANRCPYQEGSLCTARQGRTLGCRLYLCRAGEEQREQLAEISARSHMRLRAIHDEIGIAYDYAPFLEHLKTYQNHTV